MDFHRSIATFADIFFPLKWCCETPREDENNEDEDVYVERTRLIDSFDFAYSRAGPNMHYDVSASHEGGDIETKYGWLNKVSICLRCGERESESEHRILPSEGSWVRGVAESGRLFQDRLDLRSETDVIKECRTLNKKISSTALSLVDEWLDSSITYDGQSSVLSAPSDFSDENVLLDAIGKELFDAITHAKLSPPSEQLQNWVTDALQASAVSIARNIVSRTFCPALSSNTDGQALQMFEDMISRETQATALRWRALTYSHSTQHQGTDAVIIFITHQKEVLANCFRSIFILAGEDAASSFVSGLRKEVEESEIIEAAVALSKMLKTKFFSVHLGVYLVEPGQSFQEDRMENDSGKVQKTYNKPILCTLELGICEIPHEGRAERILLRPKVELQGEDRCHDMVAVAKAQAIHDYL